MQDNNPDRISIPLPIPNMSGGNNVKLDIISIRHENDNWYEVNFNDETLWTGTQITPRALQEILLQLVPLADTVIIPM